MFSVIEFFVVVDTINFKTEEQNYNEIYKPVENKDDI